ncbi:MAG: hypothetical protein ACI807_002100 [Paracoccaceae bacterium]|jgi:hypothetical protein
MADASAAKSLCLWICAGMAKGDNPAETISTHRRSPTMAALCERFFADHVALRCKPSTQGEYRRAIDLFIAPAIGAFKVADVTRADIAKLQHAQAKNMASGTACQG